MNTPFSVIHYTKVNKDMPTHCYHFGIFNNFPTLLFQFSKDDDFQQQHKQEKFRENEVKFLIIFCFRTNKE